MTRDGESCAASNRSEKGRGLNYSKRQSDARLAVTGASRGIGAVVRRGAAARGGAISEGLRCAGSIARAIRFAIEQPADVNVNQIVVRATAQEF